MISDLTGDIAGPEPLECWVCRSTRTHAWKTGNVQQHLDPNDLAITDARYGLTLPLSQCDDCGFRFADTGEVERLTELYAALDDPGYEEGQDSRALQMRWLVELCRQAHPAAKTALDIGAASGVLVGEAATQGLQVLGIEPSQSLVEAANAREGVRVLQGVLPHPDLDGRLFDIVFLVDVIEHVADPVGLLRDCADRLAEGGVLLVVTPDRASLAARLLGRRWWHYRLAHVGYFERRSLTRAAERAGLAPLSWKRARWFFPVGYLASRMEAYLPVGWLNRLALRIAPLRWLYARVIPLNLFDSWVTLLQRPASR